MKYISDIDGMRAIAVLSVVAFHAGLQQLPGGFVGVDIFFVISGFLITSLIASAVEAGHFKLSEFYVRRILRIAPALLVTVVATAGVFLLLTPPILSAKLQGSVFAALLSYSNIWFYLTTDYFQNNSDSPLLHTWSLAVEEQFYMVLPLILMAVRPWRQASKVWLLLVMAVISLVAAEWVVRENRQAAFYLPWLRAWELLAGSLLASVRLERLPIRWRQAAGALGLALVVYAIVYFHEAMAFPGISALVPVLGAVLLIVSAGAGGPVSWFLSCKPMNVVGRISYSVYLVHWPVVCLTATLVSLQPASAKAGAVVLSLLLGWLSWRLVETPFRVMAGRIPGGQVFKGFSLALAGVVGCFLLAQLASAQLWQRFPDAIRYAQALKTDVGFFSENGCFLTPKTIQTKPDLDSRCLDVSGGQAKVLIMGDSHTANLAAGLTERYGQTWRLLQASAVGCRPVVGGAGLSHCRRLVDDMFTRWIPANGHRLDEVVLSARWEQADLLRLADTVRLLRQHVRKVTVVGPWPEYFVPVPLMLAYEEISGQDLQTRLAKHDRVRLDAEMASKLRDSANYISAIGLFCGPVCKVTLDGQPLYFDRDHLSVPGVRFFLSGARLLE